MAFTLFTYDKVYRFSKYQTPVFIIAALILIGSISLMAFKTPNYGIDFTGGTVIQVRYESPAPIDEIRSALVNSRFEDAQIQEFGSEYEAVIKAPASTSTLGVDVSDEISEILKETGNFEIRRVDMVGARVGGELRYAGIMAILVSLVGVLIYITVRFEWHFAVAAVVSTANNIVVVCGFILLFNVPINLDILAAILTILGYSLNDTIVVFDRIREMLSKSSSATMNEIVDTAITRTLSRTTLTSITTLFVVYTTYIFGGELLKPLSLVLIFGITFGTFGSIYVAAPLLNLWGFNVSDWKTKEAKKAQAKAEKMRMRAMYERGTI